MITRKVISAAVASFSGLPPDSMSAVQHRRIPHFASQSDNPASLFLFFCTRCKLLFSRKAVVQILHSNLLPEKKEKASDQKVVKSEKRKFDLVVDIQEKMAQGKNGGYVRWAKKYNIKQFAESILFLQQHDIHDKETLDALVDGSSARYNELMKIIKDAEEKMAQNKVLKTHIINYAKTRDTYIAYRKSGYSKKFYEAHRDEIILHKAAKEAFSKLPDGKIPKVKDLNEEFARLLSEKK